MCGIAGVVCYATTCREDSHIALARQMCDIQSHRGPDDTGIVSLGNVCLGSVRLSILDVTEAGHMPMTDESQRWWISYNGEVYNFAELREELCRCGHIFRSHTDTEVVLHAFKEWGEQCLERFVGMFAFAVYDRQTETVTLVRDRFGIKPLYYMQLEHHLLFSSEMKALMHLSNHLRVNKQRLLEWFLYRNVDVLSPETLLEDIYAVMPGQYVTIRQTQAVSRTYYSLCSQVTEEHYAQWASADQEAVIAAVETGLHQSIKDRLVSDVPLGTLCSGGLDSSLITAIAARYNRKIMAFHVSVAEHPALDEQAYAALVASHLHMPLICTQLNGATFRRELPRAIYFSDVPLTHPNSVAFLLISQLARAHGVTVLLSGEGADELFGGYDWRYRRGRAVIRLQHLLRLLPRKLRKGMEMAGYACSGMPLTSFHFDKLLPWTVSLIDQGARHAWYRQCTAAYTFISNSAERSVLGAMLGDLGDFLTPLLRRLDRMSMGASIEGREPFLDHRLVHTVINLPLAYRMRRTSSKWVLKQIAAHYLPAMIVHRKKVGFPLPLRDYVAPLAHPDLFRNGFCSQVLALSPAIIRDIVMAWETSIEMFFGLLSLEIWGRLFILQESLGDLDELLTKVAYQQASG